jgi:hypothetical protein
MENEKYDQQTYYFYAGNKKFLGTMMSELCYIEKVCCDTAHQRADLDVVEVLMRHAFQMPEEFAPQVFFDIGSHDVAILGYVIVGGYRDSLEKDDQQRDVNDRRKVVLRQVGAGYYPDKPRKGKIGSRGEKGARQIENQYPFIISEVGSEFFYRFPCSVHIGFFSFSFHVFSPERHLHFTILEGFGQGIENTLFKTGKPSFLSEGDIFRDVFR